MIEYSFSRTEALLGPAAMERLRESRVAVFGIGGVGGYVCEGLVRSGVGAFDLIDSDIVSITNLNRQIIATQKTVGRYKTEVMKERMLDVNPQVKVQIHNCFYLPQNADEFSFEGYDYIVDAVDTVAAKLALVMKAREKGIRIISSMGAGNKLDPGRFQVADIYETRVCPLARVMRRELKKRGITSLKVVYSQEEPISTLEKLPGEPERAQSARRALPGSVAFVPSVAGLMIAGEVVKDLVAGEAFSYGEGHDAALMQKEGI